jgi:hypothetical protein
MMEVMQLLDMQEAFELINKTGQQQAEGRI